MDENRLELAKELGWQEEITVGVRDRLQGVLKNNLHEGRDPISKVREVEPSIYRPFWSLGTCRQGVVLIGIVTDNIRNVWRVSRLYAP